MDSKFPPPLNYVKSYSREKALRLSHTSIGAEPFFLGIIRDSGFPDLKLEKKINFEQLYQQRLN